MNADSQTDAATDSAEPRQRNSYGAPFQRSMPKGKHDGGPDVLRSWLLLDSDAETEVHRRAVANYGGSNTTLRTFTSKAEPGSHGVPTSLLRDFETLLKYYCQYLDFCRVFRTRTGEDLRITVSADSRGANAAGVWIDEAVQDSVREIAIEKRLLRSYSATSGIQRLSIELIQDAGVDIQRLVAEALASRIGRLFSASFTNGTGSGEPTGLLNDVGGSTGIPTVATVGAGAITLDDLVATFSELDPAHQASPSCRWLMSPAVYGKLLALKDSTGRGLFAPGGESSANPANTLLGKPVVLCPDMENAVTTGKPAIVVGDFNQFAIRQVGDVVLRKSAEKYWDSREIGYAAFARADSILLDRHAFRAIVGK